MIHGNIKTFRYDGDNENLRKAFAYLAKADLSAAENGRQEIDGDKVYANIFTIDTVPVSERAPEAHNIHADIHVIIEGTEKIGIAPRDEKQEAVKDLLADEDALLYAKDVHDETFLILHPGDFVVCMPEDIHRPACTADKPVTLRKAVCKVVVR